MNNPTTSKAGLVITVLCLCEQNCVILKPETLYLFKVFKDCEACIKLADSYTDFNIPEFTDIVWPEDKEW